MKISMIDLKSQYLKIEKEINQAIKSVLLSSDFINGKAVKSFEKSFANYLDVKYLIPCGNGTDALQIALMALDLKKDDEIILPSFTFISTLEVVSLFGLKPILIDVFEDTFTINYKDLESKITSRTKAIIPVHLFGQSADMEEIMNIAKKYQLYIIEDNAQSVGTNYYFSNKKSKKTGNIADISCTSFFPTKNLGAYGDAGAISTNNEIFANKIRAIVNHGSNIKYHHEIIGVNSRLDTIQASILQVKLKYLDEYNKKRQDIAQFYDDSFKNNEFLEIPKRNINSTHIFHQYTMKLKNGVNRNNFQNYLKKNGIPSMVYYPIPLHLQKAYSYLNYQKGDFPVSEYLSNHVISLPIHTELNQNELYYIKEKISVF